MSQNKVVVLTGASSGIGEATIRLLSEKGYRVYAGVRNPERVKPMLNVQYGPLDVTDEASVKTFIDWVLAEGGKIDVLINNAGISLIGPIEMSSIEEAQGLFDTNVFGPLRMIRAALPSMREARSGLIINVSSVLGFLPAPFMGLYASSKHALEGLSESLDHEIRDFNVRVVLLEPSFTKTKFNAKAAHVQASFGAYARQAEAMIKTLLAKNKSATSPLTVAKKIIAVIEGPYRMRQPADGGAALLSRLRRFMPATAVDSSLRKTFGLGKPQQ